MKQTVFLVTGIILVILAGLTAPLPGPWSIPIFALGAGLILRSSRWAKKVYVRSKGRWPRFGSWTDWGLRRESYKRRKARDEALSGAAAAD